MCTIASLSSGWFVSCPRFHSHSPKTMNGVCVKVPANSIGYFIIDVEPYMRLGAPEDMFKIYPNPSSTYFTLLNENPEFNTEEDVKIDVYSAAGAFQKSSVIKVGDQVDISDLPVGVYLLQLSQNNIQVEYEVLVKMK